MCATQPLAYPNHEAVCCQSGGKYIPHAGSSSPLDRVNGFRISRFGVCLAVAGDHAVKVPQGLGFVWFLM